MILDVVSAVADLIDGIAGVRCEVGVPVEGEGVTLQMITGGTVGRYYSKHEFRNIALSVHAKSLKQSESVRTLSRIRDGLTLARKYPAGPDWWIKTIETNGVTYVTKEPSSKLWHFVLNIDVLAVF